MENINQKTPRTYQHDQETKDKIPWLFGLEIKDLTNPITLRRIRLLQFGLLFAALTIAGYYVWENYVRAPSGLELVNEMVDAAGGMAAWNKIKTGQFTRTQNNYGTTREKRNKTEKISNMGNSPEHKTCIFKQGKCYQHRLRLSILEKQTKAYS